MSVSPCACPLCSRILHLPDYLEGQEVQCGHCRHVFAAARELPTPPCLPHQDGKTPLQATVSKVSWAPEPAPFVAAAQRRKRFGIVIACFSCCLAGLLAIAGSWGWRTWYQRLGNEESGLGAVAEATASAKGLAPVGARRASASPPQSKSNSSPRASEPIPETDKDALRNREERKPAWESYLQD